MIKPFTGKYRVSQKWGANPSIYKRFGLKGHNGIDWAIPTGTKILTPHEGVVIEAQFDKTGYGNYVKIENKNEGSILAHLKEYLVKKGDRLKEGELVGISNNTGFSTGPHLHWGYFPKPRKRGNGYSGTIDQMPLLKSSQQPMNDLQERLNKYFNQKVTADFVTKWADDRKAEIDRLNKAITEKDKKLKDLQAAVSEGNRDIKDLNNLIKKKNAELDRLEKDIVAVKTELKAQLAQQKTDCQRRLEKSKEEYLIDLKREKENFKLIKDGLEEEIRKLKQGQVEPKKPREGLLKRLVDLLDAIWGYDQ